MKSTLDEIICAYIKKILFITKLLQNLFFKLLTEMTAPIIRAKVAPPVLMAFLRSRVYVLKENLEIDVNVSSIVRKCRFVQRLQKVFEARIYCCLGNGKVIKTVVKKLLSYWKKSLFFLKSTNTKTPMESIYRQSTGENRAESSIC